MILAALYLALVPIRAMKFDDFPTKPGKYNLTQGDRTYILEIPPQYDGKKKLPLVTVLHGWTSNGSEAYEYTNMGKEAAEKGFILLSPDGLGTPRGWNTGFLNLGGKGIDDGKFIEDLIHGTEMSLHVDLKRVYICGHSNGAMMTYVMGSKMAGELAGIGVVAGTIGMKQTTGLVEVTPPSHPVNAIIFHGTADNMVAFNDSSKSFLKNNVYPDASAKFWAVADGITGDPRVTKLNEGKVEDIDYKGASGIEVKLLEITGGTHPWPGGLDRSGPETATGINAADLIWNFFASHSLGN